MGIPIINIYNNTGCPTCHSMVPCSCLSGQSADVIQQLPQASVPCDSSGCEEPTMSVCVLYDGEDIPGIAIKKGDNLTSVVNVLVAAIKALQG